VHSRPAAGEFEAFVGEGEFADDGVVHPFDTGAVELHVVRGPADTERVACVESSPMRSVSRRSSGSGPASTRRMATASSAIPSQSEENSVAFGLRNTLNADLKG
jgi:hypothetical protein